MIKSDRDAYITKLYEEKQNQLVNVRSALTSTSTVLTWSHRTTSCDVISTITTTVVMKNGDMKDIKMYNNNLKFKTPGKKSSAINMYQNPLANGLGDEAKARKMCCEILRTEKKAFMAQLQKSRSKRLSLETIASIIIQTAFRRYFVRKQRSFIKRRCEMRDAVYSFLKKSLEKNGLPPITTRGEHRKKYIERRQHAATVIQCLFRSFVSKNYINRLRFEFEIRRINNNVIRIQNMVRSKIARDVVQRKLERTTLQKRTTGALIIQCQIRMLLSKRKVAVRKFKLQWLAARLIQGCFRGRNTRRCMAVYLAAQEKVKFFRAARSIQKIVRARIARSRAARIKLRYLYLKIFRAVTRIQSMVRKYFAIIRVQQLAQVRQVQNQKLLDVLSNEDMERRLEEAKDLMNSMDIFFQTKEGAAFNVDALYHSELEGGASPQDVATAVNDIGDTILSHAARYNRLDIIRKCIKWGYDVNHVNALGETVIAIAATAGHLPIVTYMLSDSALHALELSKNQPKELENAENEDDETFLTSYDLPEPSTNVLDLHPEDCGAILVAAAKHKDLTHLKMIIENRFITNINEAQPMTALTALHVACEMGYTDHVDFLLKNGARVDKKDENGQLVLHKAAASSVKMLTKILNLTPIPSNEGGNEEESKKMRAEYLLAKDSDGKDCFIIASLRGQTEVVEYIKNFVDMSDRNQVDVGWSSNDHSAVMKLVENGNLQCLKNVINEGFDASWPAEESGVTLSMMASKFGKTDILEYLITEVGADFAACDSNGLNSFHYGAQYLRRDVIPLLLSFGDRAMTSCNISNDLLTVQDKRGFTPVHFIAQYGSSLSFDLLAQEQLLDAINNKRDFEGCTPLLIACKNKQSNKIKELLMLGANASLTDSNHKNALWHYFIDVEGAPDYALTVNPSFEIEIVQSLLSAGCHLFSSSPRGRDVALISKSYSDFFHNNRKKSVKEDKVLFQQLLDWIQPPDLAAVECKLTFFNALATYFSPEDCWGAMMSAMFFSEPPHRRVGVGGSSKCLASLFDGNALSVLNAIDIKKTVHQDPLLTLQSILYNNVSILGWAIKSKNESALTFLFRKGLSPNASVDENGNNCLHWAVMYGTGEIVYAVLDTTESMISEVVLLEGSNKNGFSASMLGAKVGEFQNTKRVIQLGASARRSLRGKYWAWILALAVNHEKREINSQTGVYGSDDDLYFPLHPNHNLMYSD